MSMIQYCPKCKKDQWFEKVEYSKEHLVMACEECKKHIRTDLEWED